MLKSVRERMYSVIPAVCVMMLCIAHPLFPQEADTDSTDIQEMAVKVYLDDMWGVSDYVKKEITYVNYVRDRKDAQVHIIMADQRTGGGSRIHDQLGLPKRGATEEEVLLHRREIATQYSFHAGFGLNYTFGSIYSNVVNPRFGSGH